MELEKEFIEQHKLSEDQVKAISSKFGDVLANEKKTIEETLKGEANKNAEGILSGAAALTEKQTGIKRNEGEKLADYLNRASSEHLSSQKSELERLRTEYEEKVKKASGSDIEAIKAQYSKEKDDLLKKYADYDEIKSKAEKADEYGEKLTGLKKQVAYASEKPSFPDTVNKYEAKAKWDEFVSAVDAKYNIELDENNQAICIDKENRHKVVKLSELVANDQALKELSQGRQQQKFDSRQKQLSKIEGVPFEVPVDATNKDIDKAVKDYLATQNLSIVSDEYAKKYAEYVQKIKQKTAA